MFVDQLLTMGLPLIDKSLDTLVTAMQNGPDAGVGRLIREWARSIGASLALGVGAYEAWMMILGRRGIDAMKILRIIVICLCIGQSSTIVEMCRFPGDELQKLTKKEAAKKNDDVDKKEKEVAEYQTHYVDSLRSKLSKLDEDRAAQRERDFQEASKDMGILDKIGASIDNWKEGMSDKFNTWAKATAATAETKVAELANDIIRFIGEVIFQMIYYGMLVGQSVFLNVLGMFAPMAFAMSLAPPFKSAWSQWLSKFLSVSLWGFLVFMIVYYVDYLLIFYLQQDLEAYKGLLGSKQFGSWDQIGTLGIQAIGTTCMYVVGLLAGAKIMAMVPEVCSWLIPGGVSSSMGQASAGVAAAAGGFAGSAAKGGISAAAHAPGKVAQGVAKVIGGINQAKQDGHSAAYGVFAQTKTGQSYAKSASNSSSLDNAGKKSSNKNF